MPHPDEERSELLTKELIAGYHQFAVASMPAVEVETYRQAIERGCLRAGVPIFPPNQIRHSFGTRVEHEFGLEAAQAPLGHAKANTTEIYAEKNAALAYDVAAKIG